MTVVHLTRKIHLTHSIALCQIEVIAGDVSGNIARIERAMGAAKEQGAHIACFPETALYGWVNPEAHERADTIPGRDANLLCALAKRYGLYLCVGLCEKVGDALYDSAILVDDAGQILLKHQKINTLTNLLEPPYTRGTEVQVVDTPFGCIGLLICADTFDDDVVARMAALKPDLLLVPFGWAADPEEWPEHGDSLVRVVTKAAQDTMTPVIGVNCIGTIAHGPWAAKTFGGLSVASDADGLVLARGADRETSLEVIQLVKS